MEKILQDGADGLGPEVVTLTGPNRYRPPPGFMNEQPTENTEADSMEAPELLNRLRARAGKWHQLAKLLPALARAGYDNTAVAEATGITPVLQNRWMVAATVYDSLETSGKLAEEQLARFDSRGDDMLYPFRNLPQDMRVTAAQYVLENGYDTAACEVLARAMKEWERRPLERLGFADLPGDCMAFKYLRDALECRKVEDAEKKMRQALATAVTEDARARISATLHELLGTEASASGASGWSDMSPTAQLTVLRLEPEDLGFRPVPVLGELAQARVADLDAAPRTSQAGAFGVFAIEAQAAASRWVALPQWKALAMMRVPVAVTIANLAAAPGIVAGTKAKTDDDKKRLAGAGILVADKGAVADAELDVDAYYLACPAGGTADSTLQLLDGAQVRAKSMVAVATVAFVARPPARDIPEGVAGPGGKVEPLLQL